MQRLLALAILISLTGCAIFGGGTVDKKSIPALEKVAVVSYENNSIYPGLTDTVRLRLNTCLVKITKPHFVLHKEASKNPIVKEIARDRLAKPEERERIKETLGVDAVMFCTINSASFSEPSRDADPGGIATNVDRVPTGRKDGSTKIESISMSFKSSPKKKAKVSMSVEIISLTTGEVIYSNTEKFHDDRKRYSGKILLQSSARSCAGAVMDNYKWPGLED